MREPDNPQMGWLDWGIQKSLEEEDAVDWGGLDGVMGEKKVDEILAMDWCR